MISFPRFGGNFPAMKSILICLLMFTLAGLGTRAFTQGWNPYPIPSCNVTVDGVALFEESGPGSPSWADGRRVINTSATCNKSVSSPCTINVWFFSLDGLDILGPFSLTCGGSVSQAIDDRPWGALVQAGCEVEVDVWINEPGGDGMPPLKDE
jgi:hypothetical protein